MRAVRFASAFDSFYLGGAGDSAPRLLTGDLDGDGHLDFASTLLSPSSPIPGQFVLLRGKGGGSFVPIEGFAGETSEYLLLVVDLDADGHLDLVSTSAVTKNLNVRLGKAGGGWESPQNLALGDFAGEVVATDVSGDGHLDLVAAKGFGPSLVVYLSKGDGSFEMAGSAVAGATSRLLAGDVDEDGHVDLVSGHHDGSLNLLLGHGDGTFEPPVAQAPATLVGSRLHDLDADGHLDLVLSSPGSLRVRLGAGDGTFNAPTSLPVPDLSGALVADVDGDGHLDLVAISPFGQVSSLRGVGDGSFLPAQVSASGPWLGSLEHAIDVDEDGHLDLVGRDSQARAAVVFGVGDGTFRPRSFDAGPWPVEVAIADLDADGKLDLVASNSQETVSVLRGAGDASFGPPLSVPVSSDPGALAVADFNGDGRPDLAVADRVFGPVRVVLSQADGSFSSPVVLGSGLGQQIRDLVTGDLDGDGRADLVAIDPHNGRLAVLRGQGDGTFVLADSVVSPVSEHLAVADINEDGRLDLVGAGDFDSSLTVWMGHGDGTFEPPSGVAGSTRARALTVGDFNGDGHPDVVLAHHIGPLEGTLHLGRGDGTFEPSTTLPLGLASIRLVSADVNGDGDLDLISAVPTGENLDVGDAVVLLGHGDGAFEPPAAFMVAWNPTSLTAGDLDGDGKADLALSSVLGEVSVLRNTSP